MTSKHLNPDARHDFVLLFDATDCNPNGNPDSENRPRTDSATGQGLVTDVALKRKVRNAIAYRRDLEGDPDNRLSIFVEKSAILNDRIDTVAENLPKTKDEPGRAKGTTKQDAVNAAMAAKYLDVRLFGAVLSTGARAKGSQLTGPIQIGLSRSVDPIAIQHLTVTRMAATKGSGREGDTSEQDRTMGGRYFTPYGLYVCRGSFAPHMAVRDENFPSAKVDQQDLELFWWALSGAMFDLGLSHSKMGLATRGLFVFTHDHMLGSAPRAVLHDSVTVTLTSDVEEPRSFSDYEVSVGQVPDGITLTRLI